MSRDRLTVLLWEDMPDTQARGNLRQLLAATRRPAPFLEADGGSIGFSAEMVETDLAAFEAAIAQDTPAALEHAAALYRADLLDGFSLRDRNFNEWLTGERPFRGTFIEVASQQRFADPPPMRQKAPAISPEIEQVVMVALAKEPLRRFANVEAFANAFEQAIQAPSSSAPFYPDSAEQNEPTVLARRANPSPGGTCGSGPP